MKTGFWIHETGLLREKSSSDYSFNNVFIFLFIHYTLITQKILAMLRCKNVSILIWIEICIPIQFAVGWKCIWKKTITSIKSRAHLYFIYSHCFCLLWIFVCQCQWYKVQLLQTKKDAPTINGVLAHFRFYLQ